MILIIGGAYQGKLDYARERFSLCDEDIFDCRMQNGISPDCKCIYHLEAFSLQCVKRAQEPRQEFDNMRGIRNDDIIIAEDISCGVVPMDPVMREWREAHGRLVNYISHEADEVIRLFCGLPQMIKVGKGNENNA